VFRTIAQTIAHLPIASRLAVRVSRAFAPEAAPAACTGAQFCKLALLFRARFMGGGMSPGIPTPRRGCSLTVHASGHIVAREAATIQGGFLMPTASAPRLTDFYLRLADDPFLLEAYERDPRRVLADAGLAAAEIEALLESPERARAALDAEVSSHPDLRRLVVTPRMKTMGPDDDDDGDDDGGDDDGDDGGGDDDGGDEQQ
jgi:hypothetical protein